VVQILSQLASVKKKVSCQVKNERKYELKQEGKVAKVKFVRLDLSPGDTTKLESAGLRDIDLQANWSLSINISITEALNTR
jgi:hypothetical protein